MGSQGTDKFHLFRGFTSMHLGVRHTERQGQVPSVWGPLGNESAAYVQKQEKVLSQILICNFSLSSVISL